MKKSLFFVSCLISLALATGSAAAATKVFLLAGQSNMGGVGRGLELLGTPLEKYFAPQPNVKMWSSTNQQWITLSSQFEGNGTFGPEVSFGYQMHAAFPNDDIYLVKCAYGATSLYSDWKPGDNGGWCYQAFKSISLKAIENLDDDHLAPTVAGMLWMQGEHDATSATFAGAYQANLIDFIAAVRADFNESNMPFVLGRILPDWGWPGYNTLVRTAQVTVPTLVDRTAWVDTDDLQISPELPPHYGTEGQIELGILFAGKLTATPEPSIQVLLLTGMVAGLACTWWKRRAF